MCCLLPLTENEPQIEGSHKELLPFYAGIGGLYSYEQTLRSFERTKVEGKTIVYVTKHKHSNKCCKTFNHLQLLQESLSQSTSQRYVHIISLFTMGSTALFRDYGTPQIVSFNRSRSTVSK